MLDKLNPDQHYLATEFYEDWRAGRLSRRSFIRRIVYIAGGMAAAITLMSALGCTAAELPSESDPLPTADPEDKGSASPPDADTPELVPVPGAQSPLSVPEGDPAVVL